MSSSPQLRRLLPGFIAVALVCRTPITSVPPALGAVRSGLDLSPTLAGLTTTLPLLCFGIMAFATPWLVARWGTERTTLVALVVAGVGILTRSAPTVGTFYLGATLMGAGIAILNVVLPAIVRSRFPQQVPRMTSTYTVCMIFGASVASAATAPLLTAGVGWPATLGIWAIPVILALVMWAAAARKIAAHPTGGHAAPPQAPSGLAHVVRLPRTWFTAVFMGMQSLCFYIPLTWIPDILHSHGASLSVSGLLLAVYMGNGDSRQLLRPPHGDTPAGTPRDGRVLCDLRPRHRGTAYRAGARHGRGRHRRIRPGRRDRHRPHLHRPPTRPP